MANQNKSQQFERLALLISELRKSCERLPRLCMIADQALHEADLTRTSVDISLVMSGAQDVERLAQHVREQIQAFRELPNG